MINRITHTMLIQAMTFAMQARFSGRAVRATHPQYDNAMKAIEGYSSRGHGGKRAHKPTGIAKARRAARKARDAA